MALLLDTSVLIDALKGRPAGPRLEWLATHGETLYASAISAEEIARGIRDTEVDRAQKLIQSLLLVPIESSIAWRAGIWRRDFSRQGTTLAQSDCLIAACATAVSAILVTGNTDDFPMSGIAVEHWPVGE